MNGYYFTNFYFPAIVFLIKQITNLFIYLKKRIRLFNFIKLKIEMDELRQALFKSIPLFWKRSQKCKRKRTPGKKCSE